MLNIQNEEQIVTDWMTHSEEESDNLNEFHNTGPEVLIETSSTSSNQNSSEPNPKRRKTTTANFSSGKI